MRLHVVRSRSGSNVRHEGKNGSENNKTTWLDISPENCSTNSNVLPGQPLGPLLTVDLFRTASGTGSSCAIATFLPPGSDGRSPVGERPSGLRPISLSDRWQQPRSAVAERRAGAASSFGPAKDPDSAGPGSCLTGHEDFRLIPWTGRSIAVRDWLFWMRTFDGCMLPGRRRRRGSSGPSQSAMPRIRSKRDAAGDCRISSSLKSTGHNACNAMATMQTALAGKSAEMA